MGVTKQDLRSLCQIKYIGELILAYRDAIGERTHKLVLFLDIRRLHGVYLGYLNQPVVTINSKELQSIIESGKDGTRDEEGT